MLAARAAQPARADRATRVRAACSSRRRPSRARAGARDVIDRQIGHLVAAGRRPARRLAHHARQDRAAHASASTSRESSTRALETARPLAADAAPAARGRAARRAAVGRRRPGPARAGGRQPAQQRGQVHGDGGRIELAVDALGGGDGPAGRDPRARQRRRHRARTMLPRVFDLFVQAEQPPDRSEGGLGIGLTLVRELVELHGGSVEASSAGPGQGSEFVVRLPLAATARAGGGRPRASARPRRRRRAGAAARAARRRQPRRGREPGGAAPRARPRGRGGARRPRRDRGRAPRIGPTWSCSTSACRT